MIDQKRWNNKGYWERNKESIATIRKEKSKEKKKSQSLTKRCKSCNKYMVDRSILKHLSQKESCVKDYTEEEMEYLRNLAKERHNSKKSNYYTKNKASIISKKAVRYKQQKEEKKVELRRKGIERAKKTLKSLKKGMKEMLGVIIE